MERDIQDVVSFGTASNVRDMGDGKRVTVNISSPDIGLPNKIEDKRDRMRDFRARSRALVAAGFAKEGFLRKLDLQLDSPKIERRTEIIDATRVGDHDWSYTIHVRPGAVLQ